MLRDELDLTGAKYGCGEGQCGACTVLVAGRAVRACVVAVHTVTGQPITTIEGLEQQGRLHPLQEAFLAANALQCGYCTAGMIMAGVGLLQKHPHPTAADIRHALEGHICRCGTYPRIVFEAVEFADGQILNPDFARYRVPRFSDVPPLETLLLDRPDLPSAGAGECPIVAVAPAVANAIFNAAGVRLRALPLMPHGLQM